ncbi:hypothetical protein RJ527_00380 [Thalassospiraceae bacterium LMO-SO8]|nr:pyrimidine dimer DNA glycosylase/endonuclease V [Alphaproteobacteria bacterium LMO-S08]WND76212.1 hypothetical protein RJ527_00380 [Thalassospiraceae bacterium LMO-SO8]
MNIFYLDPDPATAVRYHCDQHVWKMPLETVQILCTALRRHGLDAPYRPTHPKHPSVLWAGDNLAQWRWLYDFGRLLFEEYTFRRDREHASQQVLEALPADPPLPDGGWTPPPQAMPDHFKHADPVTGYRAFYAGEKLIFPGKGPATWTRRARPPFMPEMPALQAG